MTRFRWFLLALLVASGSQLVAQQQTTGYIKTKVNPGRAGVFVDGKYVGPAANFRIARKYAISPGEHEIMLVDPRFEQLVTKVSVEAGKTATISQTLKPIEPAKPPFGKVRTVHADKFAPVFVNGKYFGHVDEFSNFAQGILLNPGEYEVKIEPASGSPVIQKVKVEAGQTAVVK